MNSKSLDQKADEQANLDRFSKLETYLSYDPANSALIAEALELAEHLDKWDVVLSLLENAVKTDPDQAEFRAHLGLLLMRLTRWAEAKEQLLVAVKLGLDDININYNLAFCQYYTDSFEEAVTLLGQVPADSTIARDKTLLLARCEHNLGHYENAKVVLAAYLEDQSEDLECRGLYALILADLGEDSVALEVANEALTEEQKPMEALLARADILFGQQEFDFAKRDYLDATVRYPSVGRAWSGLGQMELNDFNFMAAITSLEKAVELMPNHIGTWHALAWSYLLSGEVEKSLEAFMSAYNLDPNFGETHGGLAAVYSMQGENDKAQKHIRLAGHIDPDSFSSVFAKIVLLNRENKVDEAKQLFNKSKNSFHPRLGFSPDTLIKKRIEAMSLKSTDKH